MHGRPARGLWRAALVIAALACGSFIATPNVAAQILNIEKRKLDRRDDDYLVGNVGVNFNFHNRSQTLQEPVRVMSTGIRSHMGYFADANAYQLINDYELLRVNGDAVIDTGVSHFRVQAARQRLFSYEAYLQYQHDRPRGLTFRGLAGLGARMALLRSDTQDLTCGLGPMLELEYWSHPTEDRQVRARFLKVSSYLSTRLSLGEQADANAIIYYQAGYDPTPGLFRQRMTGEVNLSAKLTSFLSLTSSFQAAYETQPLVPILRFVFATTNGVRADF